MATSRLPRPRVAALACIVCAWVTSTGATPQHGPGSTRLAPPLAQAVDAVGLTVSDMDRAVEFFSQVLTFEKTADDEVAGAEYERLQGVFGARARVVRMRLGDEAIELTEFLVPKGRPIPMDSRSHDRWFQHIAIIVSDMDAAYARLRQHRVTHASPEPQRLPDWNKNAGGIKAFYFKDPDGHPLEILQFPVGKGNAKWHRPSNRLFLGIDHTAIVVDDTDRSVDFYRDLLGFRVAGESVNYGIEQERLNNVFGARLRITGLAVSQGPGVELLEYLAPSDGRSTPDVRANDLAHWETIITAPSLEEVFARLVTGRVLLVSPSVAAFSGAARTKRLLVRDPDGHGVKLVQ